MNASVTFSTSPWLLFLIIPIVAVIFALVFARKKRGSRISVNLILSAILQCIVGSLFVFVISGLQIEYDEKNIPREAVVLVDSSYTAGSQRESMDNFVNDVIKQSVGRCRVGVVLFGKGQEVALDMIQCNSYEEADRAYQKYIEVSRRTPLENATDIGAALRFVWNSTSGANNFISDPTRARIVILSDGLETDGDSLNVMKELARGGIQIETAFYADSYLADTSILEVIYPEKTIYSGEDFEIKVKIKSSHQDTATLSIIDKDEQGNTKEEKINTKLQAGIQTITLNHKFDNNGFHELVFTLDAVIDEKTENNIFCSYFEVADKNKILILETYDKESTVFKNILDEAMQKGNIEIDINNIKSAEEMTAKDLSQYSEVILYNSAANDMTEDFQLQLQIYVQGGGGLFTIGGFEKDEEGKIIMTSKSSNPDEQVPLMHSYRESDLKESILADMLPVSVESYNPPVAVVFIFDISTSMTGSSGSSIETAAEDARYILDNVLDSRDYVAIVTLQTSYTETTPLSPITKKEELKETITELEDYWNWDASTKFAPAIEQATRILANAPVDVARKHIILFSDGGPGDSFDAYGKAMEDAYNSQGINITVVTYYRSKKIVDGVTYYFNHAYDVVGYHIKVENMDKLAGVGHGHHLILPRGNDYRTQHGVAPVFQTDLKLDDVFYETYSPKKGEESPILGNITGLELQNLMLKGYFPSKAKIDEGITVPLRANGAPLYAEWGYGEGKVGSILIDLEGELSSDLLTTTTGKTLISNMVLSLLMNVEQPQEEISFEVTMSEDNFHTRVNVFNLEQDEAKIVAMVQAPDMTIEKFNFGSVLTGCHFEFENSQTGVYNVYVMKVHSNFDFMGSNVSNPADIPNDMLIQMVKMHRTFSYSKEFDGTADPYTEGRDLLAALSSRKVIDGNVYSKFVYDAEKIFSPTGYTHFVKDLRQWLLITAMVLYLAGIIFRLFKIRKRKSKIK